LLGFAVGDATVLLDPPAVLAPDLPWKSARLRAEALPFMIMQDDLRPADVSLPTSCGRQADAQPARSGPLHGESTAGKRLEWLQAAGFIALTTAAGWLLEPWAGYRSAALLYLLAVVGAAFRLGRWPVLTMAAVGALLWDFFFIPPRYGFHMQDPTDAMMCAMLFIVALALGHLTTRLRLHERELQVAEVVQASERLRRTLLDSVSHELKTPLAALQAATDGLQRDPSQQEHYMPELHAALRRLRRTVDNLLNMTRLESGAIKPSLDWCDIDELCDAAMELAGHALAGHEVSRRVPAQLPMVKLDQALVEQALANLLLNAAMHTPAGTEVVLRADLSGDRLTLAVLDRGPGLPEGDASALFQKFSRGERAPAGGSGLGLAIARGFARAHGGDASASPRPGGGAEFRLTLPVQTLDHAS
jgi:two-component system sensor histidine kinase KdpD